MPHIICHMRGRLEPITLEDDFNDTANKLNHAAAAGKEFVATTTEHGNNVLLKMDNILSMTEVADNEETGLIG